MKKNQAWQKILFVHIREYLPEEVNLAKWLGEILSLDLSNVYRRLKGEKPLSLPELNLIAGKLPELPLVLERIWSVENRTYSLLAEIKNWPQVQEFLKQYIAIYQKGKQNGSTVLSSERTVPFCIILENDSLLKLTFTIITGENMMSEIVIPHPVKRLAGILMELYSRADSAEIWNYKGMIQLLHLAFYMHGINIISQKELAHFKQDLRFGVERYFERAIKGEKPRGGKMELFISEFGMLDNLVLDGGSGTHCSGSLLDSLTRFSQDSRAAALLTSRWKEQRALCIQVGPMNLRHTQQLRREILDQIEQLGVDMQSNLQRI